MHLCISVYMNTYIYIFALMHLFVLIVSGSAVVKDGVGIRSGLFQHVSVLFHHLPI